MRTRNIINKHIEGKNSFIATKIDGKQLPLCQEHVFFVHNQGITRVTPDKTLTRKPAGLLKGTLISLQIFEKAVTLFALKTWEVKGNRICKAKSLTEERITLNVLIFDVFFEVAIIRRNTFSLTTKR